MTTNGIQGGASLSYHHTRNSGPGEAANKSMNPKFREGMTIDEVEISDEARELWKKSVAEYEARIAKTGSDMHRDIKFSEEDLESVKARFSALRESKAQLQAGIDKALKDGGVSIGGDKLKIELDSQGKIIVGGIADAKKAKAVEAALNKDPSLAKQIRSYREEEAQVSKELESVTGQSLSSLRQRLTDTQNGIYKDGKPIKNSKGESYSQEDMMNFQDQDLYWVDPEFTREITEYFSTDSRYDLAPGNDILADPAASMNSMAKKIRDGIEHAFKENNALLRDKLDPQNADDEEMLQSMTQSLRGVKISIDAGGNVTIDGKVSEDAQMNEKGLRFIQEYVDAMMRDNPVTGEQNPYKIAAERLVNLYEDENDAEANGTSVVTTIANGKVESHLSSPRREEELREGIQADFNEAVEKKGGMLKEKLDIDIDDNGKIIVTNGNVADARQQKIVANLLDTLNNPSGASVAPGQEGSNSTDGILGRIRRNLNELSAFKQGGAAKI